MRIRAGSFALEAATFAAGSNPGRTGIRQRVTGL